MRLTKNELARESGGYTIAVRPNKPAGGWRVSVVEVRTGHPLEWPWSVVCEQKADIHDTVSDLMRWMDKTGFGTAAASASRDRRNSKYRPKGAINAQGISSGEGTTGT